MNESTKRFVAMLKRDIAQWEDTASFLEDPKISIEDIMGATQDKASMIARYRALAGEYRELLSHLTRG